MRAGEAQAAKRAGEEAREGVVQSYIHAGNKIGVLVEVDCQTDFVARNEKFVEFARDLALHIAAAAPMAVTEEEVPAEDREREERIAIEQAADRPENVRERIVTGKVDKWLDEVVLLRQKHVNEDKHGGKTIEELRAGAGRRDAARTSSSAASLGSRSAAEAVASVSPQPPSAAAPAYRRILLKLSGEALMGDLEYGTDPERVQAIASRDRGRSPARRGGRDRRRRRQHLPRPRGRRARAWTAPPATTWGCSRPC